MLTFDASAVCCPGPDCEDGTETHSYCGVGHDDFWHPFGGCNFFGCACKGGCRESKNLEECLKYCGNREFTCEEGCTGLQEVCVEACKREQFACNDRCQRKFP